ncbi:MAG: isochorismatase [Cyanobacteria bacterium SID2]|nr:isochorismatase [Cyanobacteria bacterium SID2]MBP0003450.1 isochorismatase [Cyanobacteria bacterium SBC]
MSGARLPIPSHFKPETVGQVWRVPYLDRSSEAQKWAQQYHLSPASRDRTRVGLLLIDVQNTFCIPGFELFVGGRSGNAAVEDNQRLCEFIYRHLNVITEIIPTMDTHTAMQIFHPMFWVNDRGEHPPEWSVLELVDIERGTWRISPEVVPYLPPDLDAAAYARHYVGQLTQAGKYPLTIWPYHAMLGGIGHALVSAVEEACFFHSVARCYPTRYELKGDRTLTENYSVLRPEVLDRPDGKPIAPRNTALLDRLLAFDVLIVAGQAKSHCVAWTLADLCEEIQQRNPDLARNVYLLEDCTSAVVVPDVVDFTDLANEAFDRFEKAGMHRVRSIDSMETWDGIDAVLG